ncbi:hypothetical protein GOP47_0010642 [Adiantum capillus-veneris]|uniref:EF-hand domain-containing protein n=1 Tax=Adiantum capillus-veneris TaxID=13818 RepID=A0A9D4ZIX5_ADICA|nr:hypothetical protein GOP47_0010642 [Adiantum capillus-veneris]
MTEELQEVFRAFDLNGDGRITMKELEIVMTTLGQYFTESELRETLRQVDCNGNGTIEFEEFRSVMVHETSKANSFGQAAEEIIKGAFLAFDKDQNGFISREELFCALQSLGDMPSREEVSDMIKQADKDGDGHLSYREFFQVMMEI